MKKIFVKVLLIFTILVVVVGVFGQFYLDDIVENKLKRIIQTQNDRMYDYKFAHVNLSVWTGDILISDLSIIPRKNSSDTSFYDQEEAPTVFELNLKEFKLEGLKVRELLLDGIIIISSINLDNPLVTIYKRESSKENTGTKDLVSEIILPNFKSIEVGSINMKNAKLDLYQIANDTVIAFSFDSLSYTIENIFSTPEYFLNETYFEFDNMELDLKNIKAHALKDHDLGITNAYFDMDSKEFKITGFHFKPLLDKFEFMKNSKYETDWMEVEIDTIIFKQLDLKKFQDLSALYMDEIELVNPSVSIYRDKRLPDPPYKYKALLSTAIRSLSTPFNIKRIQVLNGAVRYSEWGEVAVKPGTITLKNLTANATNITSDSLLLDYNDTLKFHCTANFMDQSILSADYSARINDKKDRFKINASLRNLNFIALNPLTEHLLNVKFTQGKLNYVNFWMNGNDVNSIGRLDIDYENLKNVQIILEKNESKEKTSKKSKNHKRLYTLFANTYILNDYNPDHKEYYQGRIRFQRLQNKFLINYIVKSLVTGLESSILPILQSDFKDMRKEKQKKRNKAKKIKK